jgi:hypothetical protein
MILLCKLARTILSDDMRLQNRRRKLSKSWQLQKPTSKEFVLGLSSSLNPAGRDEYLLVGLGEKKMQ